MSATSRIISKPHAYLKRLIARGYFPVELPPPFTTETYATFAPEFAANWDGKEVRKFWTAAERYSIPRYGDARRKLSIVNPVNQLHVADLISNNWDAIRKRLVRSKVTEFNPAIVLNGPGRAVTGVNFDGVARRRAEILSSYGRYVKTDIARFYASVYTHAIPWSILGKAHCKANHKSNAFKNSFANHLDKAVSAGQEGQTIGIPIGPDTSRILSELIAVEVEEIAKAHVSNWNSRCVRYVDDMLIGLEENETSSKVLSGLSLALYDFELEINASKTEAFGIGLPHAPEWLHYIRTFELKRLAGQQREDLDSFFEQAIVLADANPRENVLLYAVKRATTFPVDPSNMAHFVRWFLYSARRSPTCMSFVAEHLARIHGRLDMPHVEIQNFILHHIPLKAEVAHVDELAWLLFWAREIDLKVPADSLSTLVSLRSSVVALLVLDLNQRGLVEGQVDMRFWQSFADSHGLKSEMWLLSYEATKKAWWSANVSSGYVSGAKFFGDIWDKNIEFYDPTKKARKPAKSPFSLIVARDVIEWGSYGSYGGRGGYGGRV